MRAPEESTGRVRPQAPIAELIEALRSRRPVEIGHRDDYAMVRAGMTGEIAIYVHADRVAIAVTPERAYALEGVKPFERQVPRTPAISYVIVRTAGVRKHFQAVLDLAVESVDWRSEELTSAFCACSGVGCQRGVDACPNCWTEVTERGGCLCHEGGRNVRLAG